MSRCAFRRARAHPSCEQALLLWRSGDDRLQHACPRAQPLPVPAGPASCVRSRSACVCARVAALAFGYGRSQRRLQTRERVTLAAASLRRAMAVFVSKLALTRRAHPAKVCVAATRPGQLSLVTATQTVSPIAWICVQAPPIRATRRRAVALQLRATLTAMARATASTAAHSMA